MSRTHADPQQAETTSPPEQASGQQSGTATTEEQMGNAYMAELAAKSGGGSVMPQTKAEALSRHAEGVRRIDRVYRSALAQEPSPNDPTASRLVMLHNSVEWIESGRIKLQSLSPTHDSATRAPAGKVAYFDSRKAWNEPGATYDEKIPTAGPGVFVGLPRAGHMEGDKLVFFDAAGTTEDDIANTFIHEIQHACDAGPGDSFAGQDPIAPARYKAQPWVYERYRSEYRARLADPVEAARYGDPNVRCTRKLTLTATRDAADPDVASGKLPLTETMPSAFWNEQQFDIFSDMVPDPSITQWRDYVNKQWTTLYGQFAHFYVFDEAFRDMVEAFGEQGPHGHPMDGGNLVNSIRIDELATRMHANGSDEEILEAAAALDAVDRAFLQDEARSAPFWKAAEKSLASRKRLLQQLERLVETGSGESPLPYEWYKVVEGDTLSLIAERMLGDLWRWPELHALNEAVIGPDPDHIQVGIEIRLPRK